MKSNNQDMKFKGKRDTRNNNSSGTNGMHNSVPLTKEYQIQLGEPKGKITEKNPKGYSKFQNKLLNYSIILKIALNHQYTILLDKIIFQVGRTACAVSLLETAQNNSQVLLRTRTEN